MRVLFDQGTPLPLRNFYLGILGATSWPRLQQVLPTIVEAISSSQQNGYIEVYVPYSS